MVFPLVLPKPIAHYAYYCHKNPNTYPAQNFDVLFPVLKNLSYPPDRGTTTKQTVTLLYHHRFSNSPLSLFIRFAKYTNGNDIHIMYKNLTKDISKEIYLSLSDPHWALDLNKIIINFQYNFWED